MPIENERKVVLRLVPGLESKFCDLADQILHIEQGYLLRDRDLTVRIRCIRGKKFKYYLTVKSKIDSKVVEIEKRIAEEDFVLLTKKAEGWVSKVRYVVGEWEVDFFKRGIDTYFVMAEIEMPDGQAEPNVLPNFVIEHLLYTVPREDTRFSSKKLSDLDHAKRLIAEISR